jgi:hypothetical protein
MVYHLQPEGESKDYPRHHTTSAGARSEAVQFSRLPGHQGIPLHQNAPKESSICLQRDLLTAGTLQTEERCSHVTLSYIRIGRNALHNAFSKSVEVVLQRL